MDIGNLNRDILQYLQQESLMPEGSELKATQEAKISRVVQNVLTNVVQEVFGEHFKDGILKKFANIPYDSKLEIFKTCLGIQEGGSSESTLIQIAKLCAGNNGNVTAAYIQNFGIKNQAALVEITKLCSQDERGGTARYIQNFGITDQAALVEIAKLCAQNNGGRTAQYVRNFGITDQAALVEIAKLCAQNDGFMTATDIQNFGITNEAGLVEIAKLCAQNDGERTAECIQKFGITEQAALIEIAKLCAQNNGLGTARYIEYFGITDQAALVEIAKLCTLSKKGWRAMDIQSFGILDQAAVFEVGVSCLVHFQGAFRTKLPDLITFFGDFPPDPESVARLTALYDRVFDPEFIKGTCLKLGEAWAFGSDFATMDVNKEILRLLFFSCLALNKMEVLGSNTIQELVHAVLDFRVPILKTFLLDFLLRIISENKLEGFDSFIQRFQVPTKPQKKRLAHIFMLTVFGMQNVDDHLKTRLVNDFLANIKRRDSFLPLAPKTGALIEFVRVLNDKVKEGRAEACDEFITYGRGSAQFSQNLFLAQAAIAFGIDIAGMKSDQVRALISQQVQLPEGFGEIFEKLRHPENLFMYVGKIRTLGLDEREQVLTTLENHLQEVTDGTYRERRYDQSPHLKKMGELYCLEHAANEWKTFIEAWKTGQKQDIEPFLGSHKELLVDRVMDGKEFFTIKRGDGHFPTDQMPILHAFLEGRSVTDHIDTIIKNKDKVDSKQLFDALCALLAKQHPMDPHLIQEALKLAPPDWEIHNDLQGLLQQLGSSSDEITGYTIENTDDHWDLFLCGTEVAGSCQRVDGDPILNKCLLGYVVDGKTRMIAVKDSSGRIVARSIIKLLWDEKQKRPILLMERVYSNITKLNGIVEQMAKEEASRLKIELVTVETAGDRQFQSYTNRSGFEYEDSEEVVQTWSLQ